MRCGSEKRRGERGQALVLFVLALAVLMGFTAMTIDVGLFLRERRNLQNAADAAALAGVLELPQSPAAAQMRAQEWAVENGIDGTDGRQVESITVPQPDRIEVTIARPSTPFIFGRVLGLTSVDIRARAVAEVGSVAGTIGLTPFGVLENVVNYCTYAQVTQVSPPASCKTTLKYDVNDVGANIGDLDFDGVGGGANEVNDKIKGGNEDPLCSINEPTVPGCSTTVPGKPGNSTGQIRTGVNWRLDNTTVHCDTVSEVVGPDTDGDGVPEVRSGCNPWGGAAGPDSDADGGICDNINWTDGMRGSCSLIAIPIIDVLPGGAVDANILGFALFWLLPIPGGQCSGNDCSISGYFINAEVSVTGLIRELDPDSTPFVVYRLVE